MFECLNVKMLKCQGFTLIEVLVSIFIIILLAGIIFANYRQSGKQLALQRSASKLALDIRRTQEMAMSAREFGQAIPVGGYGIHLDESYNQRYILFADCDGEGDYDESGTAISCADATPGPANSYPESIEGEIGFEKGVQICFSCFGATGTVDIVFIPPDPKVTFTPDVTEQTIWLTNDGQTKKIYVNKAGLIDIRE